MQNVSTLAEKCTVVWDSFIFVFTADRTIIFLRSECKSKMLCFMLNVGKKNTAKNMFLHILYWCQARYLFLFTYFCFS